MKKIICIVMALAVFITTAVGVSANSPQLPTKEYEGKTYYCINTKAQYTALVDYATKNLLEEVLVYREPEKVEYDSSWSNDVRNFCDYKSYRELKFLDYNTNTVSAYCDQKAIFDDLNCYVGDTPEAYGKLEIQYNDSSEEIKKAEAIISGVLAQVSGKSQIEKVEHIVNYVCSVAKAGSIKIDGGYDLINGVYDVITGHHTNVVCTSYTVSLQKFFECAGIESVMIHNSNHIWNMVCLDGVWYGIDATAGDNGSTMSKDYMLMGYDRLKGFDDSEQNPIATFKALHNLANKSYYDTSTTTSTHSASSEQTTGNAVSTTNSGSTSTNNSSKNSSVNSTVSNDSSQTNTEGDAEDETAFNKVTIDLTENFVISADIFKNAKEKGEEISLVGKGYSWKFSSGNIKDDASAKSFNAEVYVGQSVPQEAITAIENATNTEADKVYPFSFSHHGELPGVADITIEVAPELKGKTVYIYYLNDKNKPVQAGEGTVTDNSTLTFTTDHCSVWFLSEEKIDNENPLPIILIIAGIVILLIATLITFLLIKRKKAV